MLIQQRQGINVLTLHEPLGMRVFVTRFGSEPEHSGCLAQGRALWISW